MSADFDNLRARALRAQSKALEAIGELEECAQGVLACAKLVGDPDEKLRSEFHTISGHKNALETSSNHLEWILKQAEIEIANLTIMSREASEFARFLNEGGKA